MTLAPGTRLGAYEVIAPLGAGGMGEVYRARDPRLGREGAIKVLPEGRLTDEDRRRRFLQEARAASALNHPNIVTIHEIESVDGMDFLVMEQVAGANLRALLTRKALALGEALRISIRIADALARAHAAGIVHCDLKPANVMVGPEGVVKVLDFGLARLLARKSASVDPDRETETAVRLAPGERAAVAGTVGYMSPEQATGETVDARSDVFSFGALLYEMATGRRAFAGGSTAEALAAVVHDEPKPLTELVPTLPRELERLIQRCLRKEPGRRFQSMADVKLELEQIKEDSQSRPALAPVAARRRRGRGLAVTLGGVVILAGMAAWLWGARRAPVSPPRLVPLTSMRGSEGQPTFSPDGEQVAFQWGGERNDNGDIYLTMIGSSEIRRLTTDPSADYGPSWSPDGRQIAFLRWSGDHQDSPRFAPRRVSAQGQRLPGCGGALALVVARRPFLGSRARRHGGREHEGSRRNLPRLGGGR